MDSVAKVAWTERLFHASWTERNRMHAETGRMLTLFAAALAIVQFIIPRLDVADDQSRLLGFVAIAAILAWLFVPAFMMAVAAQEYRYLPALTRLKRSFLRFGLIPAAAATMFQVALVAAGENNIPYHAAWGALFLIALALDFGGLALSVAWKPGPSFALLFVARLLVSGAAWRTMSGIDASQITNGEKIMALWPLLAAFGLLFWFVWETTHWLHRLPRVAFIRDLLRDHVEGSISEADLRDAYAAWVVQREAEHPRAKRPARA